MTDHIAEHAEYLRRLGRARTTIETYAETLRRMDHDLAAGLMAALPEELEDWIYNDQWSASTRHQRRAAVVSFFAYWSSPKRPKRLDYNPAADLPTVSVPKGRPRPAPKDALADLIARAADPYRTWMKIAAYGGARCAEIANLDREEVGEEEMLLHGKGGKTRAVPTHELIWQAVRVLPPGPIAVGADGARLTRRDVSRRGNWHMAKLGYRGVTMHRLRHSFGTEAFEASGRDIRAVQELLGHASVATTEIYVAVSGAAKKRAVAGLYGTTR